MARKNNYRDTDFDEDWSRGPRDRKDKPGKKHNNNNHQESLSNDNDKKKNSYKAPTKFRRHGDSDEDDD